MLLGLAQGTGTGTSTNLVVAQPVKNRQNNSVKFFILLGRFLCIALVNTYNKYKPTPRPS